MNKLTGILTGGGSCTPERERYIPNKAGDLERAVTELEECFGNLQGRLQSVRSEEVAGAPIEQTAKEMSLPCPLAEHLRQQIARIRSICGRIDYQLSVLET